VTYSWSYAKLFPNTANAKLCELRETAGALETAGMSERWFESGELMSTIHADVEAATAINAMMFLMRMVGRLGVRSAEPPATHCAVVKSKELTVW
jgi:hypothetical protein